MNAIQQAEQAGFDMSLVDESLRLTYEQRANQHQMALELALALALERAGFYLRGYWDDASTPRDRSANSAR